MPSDKPSLGCIALTDITGTTATGHSNVQPASSQQIYKSLVSVALKPQNRTVRAAGKRREDTTYLFVLLPVRASACRASLSFSSYFVGACTGRSAGFSP